MIGSLLCCDDLSILLLYCDICDHLLLFWSYLLQVLHSGKIAEFDEPFELLKKPGGFFRNLVDQAGRNEASRLELLAEEAKHLRNLQLLQTKAQYPGWNITVSKSRAEIIEHFGTRVVYETTV